MIGIVAYEMGNIQSVVNAFEYLGSTYRIVQDSKGLSEVSKIVLPGVGAFSAGMDKLKKMGLADELQHQVIEKKKPFLGICLGMQLICKESFEFGHFKGFNWLDASVRRFEPELNVRVPHIGWNNLIIKRKNSLIADDSADMDVYFVHSYYVDSIDSPYVVASCKYGREFVAAIEKENIFATQFHPEKSQKVGLAILKRFAQN